MEGRGARDGYGFRVAGAERAAEVGRRGDVESGSSLGLAAPAAREWARRATLPRLYAASFSSNARSTPARAARSSVLAASTWSLRMRSSAPSV